MIKKLEAAYTLRFTHGNKLTHLTLTNKKTLVPVAAFYGKTREDITDALTAFVNLFLPNKK